MPEQFLVIQFLRVEDLSFTFSFQLEAVQDVEFVPALGVLDVLVDHLEDLFLRLNGLDLALELIIVLVHQILFRFLLLIHFDDVVSDLDVDQTLNQVELLLQFISVVNDEAAHLLEAEIVRDVRVELAREIS